MWPPRSPSSSKSEKSSLHAAMDIAPVGLDRALAGKL